MRILTKSFWMQYGKKITILTSMIFKTPGKIIQTIDLSTLKERELKDTIHFSFDF
jgi:hypothetical protein